MLSHILSQNPPESSFDVPFEPFSPNETPRRHFLSSSLHEMTQYLSKYPDDDAGMDLPYLTQRNMNVTTT